MSRIKDYGAGSNKAEYTKKELEGMSKNRRRINNLTMQQWCDEWDSVTQAIRRNHAETIRCVAKRRREREGYGE